MKGLIVGFGNMGQNHYERYKKLDVDIVGIVDNDREKRRMASNLGIKDYETLMDYLENNDAVDIDFVDICLPTDLHFNFIQQIIEKFENCPIPIIVEKPIVRTSSEADELERLAKKYPRIIFVAEVEHYNSRIVEFFKSLKDLSHIRVSRMVNKSYFLKGTNQWSLDSERSGGPILDLMIHDFSLLDSFFGEATLIEGKFKKLKYNCIDEATVKLQFSNNLTAEVTGSWLSTNENPIILTIEALEKNGHTKNLVVDDYTIRGSTYDNNDPFYLEIKAFLESINKNQQPHQLEEYLRVVRLANNIIHLAKQKDYPYEPMYFKLPEKNAEIANKTTVELGSNNTVSSRFVNNN